MHWHDDGPKIITHEKKKITVIFGPIQLTGQNKNHKSWEKKKTEFSENTINIRLFYTYKLPVIIKDILYIITKNSSFMQSSCLFTFHHFFAHNFSSYHHSIIFFVELIFHESSPLELFLFILSFIIIDFSFVECIFSHVGVISRKNVA